MQHVFWFTALVVAFSVPAFAEVTELDGEEMVNTYVQGISIGQVVTDKKFSDDDADQQAILADAKNSASGAAVSSLTSGPRVQEQARPGVNDMLANIADDKIQSLATEAIAQTSLSTRLDMNLDQAATQIISGDELVLSSAARDFTALRGTILDVLPSATGYQFEFLKNSR